jgi:hypothetical protein
MYLGNASRKWSNRKLRWKFMVEIQVFDGVRYQGFFLATTKIAKKYIFKVFGLIIGAS